MNVTKIRPTKFIHISFLTNNHFTPEYSQQYVVIINRIKCKVCYCLIRELA